MITPLRHTRSGLKTPSEAQWSANIYGGLCFQSAGRLALEPDLRF
jgi:hypothetical protein